MVARAWVRCGAEELRLPCLICMDAEIEVVSLPCGHAYACVACAAQPAGACAQCQGRVESNHRIYIAQEAD